MTGTRTTTPQLSVVVPVWDHYAGAYLDAALASLTAQSAPAEIILVDNASVVPVVVPEGADVEVVRAPTRLTTGAARNLGLTRVTTPLVVMWDADDVMLPGTLEALLVRFAAAPHAVAQALAIEDRPGVRHPWPRRWVGQLSRRPRLMALANSIWSQYPVTGATAMRTDAVRASGGCADASAGEDWSLGAALLWRGPVGWSERPGRLYRKHPTSTLRRHSTRAHLLARTRAMRSRLRADPGVPRWCRLLMPLIAGAQYALILVVRPGLALARRRPGAHDEPSPVTSAGVEVEAPVPLP